MDDVVFLTGSDFDRVTLTESNSDTWKSTFPNGIMHVCGSHSLLLQVRSAPLRCAAMGASSNRSDGTQLTTSAPPPAPTTSPAPTRVCLAKTHRPSLRLHHAIAQPQRCMAADGHSPTPRSRRAIGDRRRRCTLRARRRHSTRSTSTTTPRPSVVSPKLVHMACKPPPGC